MSENTETVATETAAAPAKRRGRPPADPNAPKVERGMSIKLSADVTKAINTTAAKFSLTPSAVKEIFVNSILAGVDASSVRKAVGAHFAAAVSEAQDNF